MQSQKAAVHKEVGVLPVSLPYTYSGSCRADANTSSSARKRKRLATLISATAPCTHSGGCIWQRSREFERLFVRFNLGIQDIVIYPPLAQAVLSGMVFSRHSVSSASGNFPTAWTVGL